MRLEWQGTTETKTGKGFPAKTVTHFVAIELAGDTPMVARAATQHLEDMKRILTEPGEERAESPMGEIGPEKEVAASRAQAGS